MFSKKSDNENENNYTTKASMIPLPKKGETTVMLTSLLASTIGKESAFNAGDPGSIPGAGRSPGEGIGNPLQYSCLENPMDREAW